MPTMSGTLATALALHRAGRQQEAEQMYRQILAANPYEPNAWHLLGVIACETGRPDVAIEYIRRALAMAPGSAEAHYNLGRALQQHENLDEAIHHYRVALGLKPDYAEAHMNSGLCLEQQGRFDAAAACYRRAGELGPDLAGASLNLALLQLLQGDFENGWPGYEWRWKTGKLPPRLFPQPQWKGESLPGKTILLHTEQGFGDTFQFIRYARLVKRLGARVIVGCQKPLANVLANSTGIDELIAEGRELPSFDYHAPLLSLPGVFKTTLATIPAEIPYLFADPDLIAYWREKLAHVRDFRIGINWHGRFRDALAAGRNIPLEHFLSLAKIPGTHFISLQKNLPSDLGQPSRLPDPIVDLGAEVDQDRGAFVDTAAIMKNLDLIISSDTSVAHLAGALGVPVWLALPFIPEWRWLLDRSDSPWYPTMRLFRQQHRGDYRGVFAEMEVALRSLLRGGLATIRA